MSREIKFRAWDNANKKWLNKDDAEHLIIRLDGSYEINKGWAIIEPDLTIEQYIGLKDKNGKEIYEGDIVEINGWWYAAGPAGYETNQCTVAWDKDRTGFAPFNNYDCDCGVYHEAQDCKVIGNIHENPELLGGEE